jgi:hypothetical protein
MAITKAQYEDMKEYWDYQRKVQYNKETIYRMAEQFENRVYSDFGAMPLENVQEILWGRIKSEDYEDPHKNWIPEDESLRFDWEDKPKERKGKLVVVKAREKWQEDFEKLINEDNNL